jgi:hypothetical protein
VEQRKQKLLNDLIEDGLMQAEERILASMLGNVKRRKNLRTASRAGLIVIFLTFVVSLWQLIQPETSSVLNVDQAPPTIEIITDSNSKLETIETTVDYVQYLPDVPVDIQMIDDSDLKQIFSGQAYAIVDDPQSGDPKIYLLGSSGG